MPRHDTTTPSKGSWPGGISKAPSPEKKKVLKLPTTGGQATSADVLSEEQRVVSFLRKQSVYANKLYYNEGEFPLLKTVVEERFKEICSLGEPVSAEH